MKMEKDVTRLAVSLALAVSLTACEQGKHPDASQRAADAEHNATLLEDRATSYLEEARQGMAQVQRGDVTREACSRNSTAQSKITPDDAKLAFNWSTSVAYRQDATASYAAMQERQLHMSQALEELSRHTKVIASACTAKYGA